MKKITIFYYQEDGRQPIENKPIKIVKFDENLQQFCVNFNQRSDYYDFFYSRSIVSDFLTVFVNNFVQRNGFVSLFKRSFTIINCQPPPRVGFIGILFSRIWQTDVHSRIYFNNYVKLNLANDILKRVIKKVKLVNNLVLQKRNLFKNIQKMMTKIVMFI